MIPRSRSSRAGRDEPTGGPFRRAAAPAVAGAVAALVRALQEPLDQRALRCDYRTWRCSARRSARTWLRPAGLAAHVPRASSGSPTMRFVAIVDPPCRLGVAMGLAGHRGSIRSAPRRSLPRARGERVSWSRSEAAGVRPASGDMRLRRGARPPGPARLRASGRPKSTSFVATVSAVRPVRAGRPVEVGVRDDLGRRRRAPRRLVLRGVGVGDEGTS